MPSISNASVLLLLPLSHLQVEKETMCFQSTNLCTQTGADSNAFQQQFVQ
jgi:hypothetical protein